MVKARTEEIYQVPNHRMREVQYRRAEQEEWGIQNIHCFFNTSFSNLQIQVNSGMPHMILEVQETMSARQKACSLWMLTEWEAYKAQVATNSRCLQGGFMHTFKDQHLISTAG